MDIFERIKTQRGNIGQYANEVHGYFAFPKLEGEIGPHMIFRGKEVLNWSLNNYVGLANHPEVRKADAEAAEKYGLAYPMGARMMSGQTTRHEYLESQLAEFVGKPDAFLLNFGYQGQVSIIDSLTSRHDCIVYDAESHACILDGMRVSPAKRYVFAHNDIDSCRKQLERATKHVEETGGGILVITEGVFGMAGDLGKLDEIVALKKEFKSVCWLTTLMDSEQWELPEQVPESTSEFRMGLTYTSLLSLRLWQDLVHSSHQPRMFVCIYAITCVHKLSPNHCVCLWLRVLSRDLRCSVHNQSFARNCGILFAHCRVV